jgi:membrane protein YqaA with SNARE-associated domain
MFEAIMLVINDFLYNYGYISLFLVSFMAGSPIPLGVPEPLIALMIATHNIYLIILVATIGNSLGSIPTYILGRMGIRKMFNKYEIVSEEGFEKAQRRFKKYGAWTLLLTSIPLIGHAIAFFAGTVKYKFKPFMILVTIGNFFRFLIVIFLMYIGYDIVSYIP